jgi:hypothetical protein
MKKRQTKTNVFLILLILTAISGGIYFYMNNKGSKEKTFVNINTSATSTKNINFDPLNFSYDIEGEKIKLVNGNSVSDIVPGSIEKLETTTFDKPAIGDLNKDNKNDSAILLTQDSGGTGLFYYLVAIINDVGVVKNTNSIFIGDRIEPVSLSIKDGKVELNYIDRNQDDPMTADPTVKIKKLFEVKGGVLSEVK